LTLGRGGISISNTSNRMGPRLKKPAKVRKKRGRKKKGTSQENAEGKKEKGCWPVMVPKGVKKITG